MSSLPSFRYHPDPVATGVFKRLSKVCSCCQRVSELIYTPTVYAVRPPEALCPWCIASGAAHETFDAEFTPYVGIPNRDDVAPWADIPEDVRDEVRHRTPGFAGYQDEHWWTHCSDAGAYLGCVGELPVELFSNPAAENFVAEMKRLHELSDEEWDWLVSTPDDEHRITFFVFRCLHCGELGGYGDRADAYATLARYRGERPSLRS